MIRIVEVIVFADVWLAANCLCDKDSELYAVQNRRFLNK